MDVKWEIKRTANGCNIYKNGELLHIGIRESKLDQQLIPHGFSTEHVQNVRAQLAKTKQASIVVPIPEKTSMGLPKR